MENDRQVSDAEDISLAADLIRLEARFDRLVDTVQAPVDELPQRRLRAWTWQDLDPEQYQARVDILSEWIETHLAPRLGSMDQQKLRPCWALHPDVLDDLTALYVAWHDAYRDPQAHRTAAITYRDRWQPSTLHRVGDSLRSCSSGHAKPYRPSRMSD